MIKITGLIIPLEYSLEMLESIAAKRLGIERSRIEHISIEKRSVDTQDKQDIHFIMNLAVYVPGNENEIVWKLKDKCVSKDIEFIYTVPKEKKLVERPVVVGCGPAGMFAALILAEAGERPILLERGLDVDGRKQKVQKFWRTGVLDTQTNVQFGEGGAGAFSDGKLKIGSKDSRKMKVLNELVEAGAPPEIMYLSKPHIGTDRLKETVKAIR